MIESGSTRAGARVVPGPDTGRATVTEKEIRGEAGQRAIGLKQTAHLIGKKRNEITIRFQQITVAEGETREADLDQQNRESTPNTLDLDPDHQ